MAIKTAVGGRESNSFCNASEADDYIALLGIDTTAWDDQDDDQKDYCLQLAAQALDLLPWRGQRVYCGQALCFPRSFQDDMGMVPDEVKQAQAQIAFNVIFRALQSIATQPTEDGPQSDSRVQRVSLGGMLDVWFSSDPAKTGTLLDRLTRSLQFPIYLAIQRFTSQVRGGTVTDGLAEAVCLTTTTTESTTSTTSTTMSTTTTTTTS
jgi:hypothetical protein